MIKWQRHRSGMINFRSELCQIMHKTTRISVAALALAKPDAHCFLVAWWFDELGLSMGKRTIIPLAVALHEVDTEPCFAQVGCFTNLRFVVRKLAVGAESTLALEIVGTHPCLLKILVLLLRFLWTGVLQVGAELGKQRL